MVKIVDVDRLNVLWGPPINDFKRIPYHHDVKPYVHPLFGPDEPYMQSLQMATKFPQRPEDFKTLVDYRRAWKEHRESHQVAVKILDPTQPDYWTTYLFPKVEEFKAWKAKRDAYCYQNREWLTVLKAEGQASETSADSFRRFSAAVTKSGLGHALSVLAVYDNLFPHRAGKHKPRGRLSSQELILVHKVEHQFCEWVASYGSDGPETERARLALRKLAARTSNASTWVH